jgi:hypothetical protein
MKKTGNPILVGKMEPHKRFKQNRTTKVIRKSNIGLRTGHLFRFRLGPKDSLNEEALRTLTLGNTLL